MRQLLLLAVLAGCAGPKLAWGFRDESSALSGGGTCAANLRVRVVDAAGAPVAGAEVFVRRNIRMNAPSTVPVNNILETAIVRTNARGEAKTCTPASVKLPGDPFFTYYDDGAVVARAGTRESTIGAPFARALVIR